MKIRLARSAEIMTLVTIAQKNFSYGERARREIRAMFQNQVFGPKYYVAEERGKIVGFAGFSQSWLEYSVYEVFWVNVLPEYQTQGVGTLLMQKVIAVVRSKKGKDRANLILLGTHVPGFYERLGFQTLHRSGIRFLLGLELSRYRNAVSPGRGRWASHILHRFFVMVVRIFRL